MFSVDINSANGANYIKPKKGGVKRPAVSHAPLTMTKNGSVFNDPNIANPTPVTGAKPSVTSARTAAPTSRNGSIFNDMNFVSTNRTSASTGSGLNSLDATLTSVHTAGSKGSAGNDDLGIGKDPSKGRAAAKELKTQTSDLKSNIHAVEGDADEMRGLSKSAKKLSKSIKKKDETFQKQQVRQNAEFKRLEEDRRIAVEQLQNAQTAAKSYSAQLEDAVQSGDEFRIASLRSAIHEQNSTITVNNQKINVIGASQKNLVKQIKLSSRNYIKANNAQNKALNENKSSAEKAREVASQIAEYSTIIQTTGEIVEGLGQLFKSMAGIPYVGAALAAAGAVMEPIGAAGKAVGQWGNTAAQITMGVAAASEGDILGAMTCCAAAVSTGTQAFNSTKQMVSQFDNLGTTFKEIKATAADAKATRAEGKLTKAANKEAQKLKEQGLSDDQIKAELAKQQGTEGSKLNSLSDKAADARTGANKAQQKVDTAKQSRVQKAAEKTAKKAENAEKKAQEKVNNAKTDKQKAVADAKLKQAQQANKTAQDNLATENSKLAQINGRQTGVEGSQYHTADVVDGAKFKDKSAKVTNGVKTTSTGKQVKTSNAPEIKYRGSVGKTVLKTIFSQQGLSFAMQSMTLAAMIIGMTEDNSVHNHSHQGPGSSAISADAQKIMAKVMARGGYQQPGMFKVRTR